ncbi:hypothetical protein [Pedobacter sp.]|uniref:hypothetical protein n=1 Tax=Pedobacter sp. TaxID=1411316 RepID=UPI00396C785A
MNNLEKYIGDLNPSCWLNSDHVNGYGAAQPSIGDDVNTWADCSGNGNDFIHEVVIGQNPPKFGEVNLFGQTNKSLNFTVANQNSLIRNSSSNTIWNIAFTLISIGDISTGWLLQNRFGGTENGSIQISDNQISSYTIGSQWISYGGNFRTGRRILIIKRGIDIFDVKSVFSQSNNYQLVNGATINNIPSSALPSNNLSLGCRLLSNGNKDVFFTGSICEVIAFPRILTQGETLKTQTYLKLKYNI